MFFNVLLWKQQNRIWVNYVELCYVKFIHIILLISLPLRKDILATKQFMPIKSFANPKMEMTPLLNL